MQQRDQWLLPEGIREVLPDEASRLEQLRREILDLFAVWGYELVIPPFVDFLDSLLTGTGHDLDLQTFKLTDQLSGRMLGVRADMTPQVARMDAHTLQRDYPSRLCYMGTVLHTRGHAMEQSRAPLQIGAELYGHGSIASDVEILRLMLEMLAVAGLEEVHLDLGHVGIFRSLSEQAGLSGAQEAELFNVLQRKARPELKLWLENLGLDVSVSDMLYQLSALDGDESVLELAAEKLAGGGAKVQAALLELKQAASVLRERFPHLPIHFDLAELRGYHYQTGLVFAAFVPGCGREIARGGRYDDIGRFFGRARPATGFSADLKMLLDLSARNFSGDSRERIFAPCDADPELQMLIRTLRAEGRVVVEALPEQQGDAVSMGCSHCISQQNSQWVIVSAKAQV